MAAVVPHNSLHFLDPEPQPIKLVLDLHILIIQLAASVADSLDPLFLFSLDSLHIGLHVFYLLLQTCIFV